ncbi:hypothetical protein TNCV_5116431 [Trichonephila clavipes]|nr:hypothetical protein TNCV_5116431 [Trichonephila clavipes]
MYPDLKDQFMAEYERLRSMNRDNMTVDELSLYFKLVGSIELKKTRQTEANYEKAAEARHTRRTTQVNDKRRKQKDPKKKVTDPPTETPDIDRCRHHKWIQKDIKLMTGRLTLLEHCINSEKEFPDLTNDANFVGYQKDYGDLVSLNEQKLGELALILPCPVLDCPENITATSNLNDLPKTNAKKHSRNASQENKKAINSASNTNDGFTSPTNSLKIKTC